MLKTSIVLIYCTLCKLLSFQKKKSYSHGKDNSRPC